MRIVIVDTGSANLLSLQKAIYKVGYTCAVSTDESEILAANKIFLPGVGAFDTVMRNLKAKSIDQIVKCAVQSGNVSILGICLGMQILGQASEEGNQELGLGFLGGISRKLKTSHQVKVPHVGFNTVKLTKNSKLLKNVDLTLDFYFVHSFAMMPEDEESTVGVTENGTEFTSVVENEAGIYGVQFHPEKSNSHGLHVIRNFLEA
jgi:glutamine amidotransferase